MTARLATALTAVCLSFGVTAAFAQVPSSILPSNGSATFRFQTTVATPKGKHSSAGTLTVKRTGGRSLTLTVQSDDGTRKTIPLIVGADGSIAPNPDAPPTAMDQPDAAARTFTAEVSLAAHVGIAARKNAPASSFRVPVSLTPVGDGAPIQTRLSMNSSMGGAQYAGSVQGNTTTTLPPNGALDPAAIAKTLGVGALTHGFTPAGRLAVAVVRHHRKKEEKKAATGPLPDAVALNVTTRLSNGRFQEIDGTQSDTVTIAGKTAKIVTTWSFTKVS